MNTVNNNNFTFKGNLVTQIKGRNNIVSDVARRFSERTASIPGALEMVKGGSEYPNAMIFRLKGNDSEIFSVLDYASLFGENAVNKTKKLVDEITTNIINIFKTLKAEETYNTEVSKVYSNLNRVERDLISNTRFLKGLKEIGDSEKSRVFESLINLNKKRINSLLEQEQNLKKAYFEKLDKLAQNDERIKKFADFEKEWIL